MAQLKITAELAGKIRAHGAETYPHECCGALLGRDTRSRRRRVFREITALFPLVNRRDDSPRNRFSVTREDVREAEKAAREQGIEVVGWYHSHPDHPAGPANSIAITPGHGTATSSSASPTANPQHMTSWRLADDRTGYTSEDLQIADVAAK